MNCPLCREEVQHLSTTNSWPYYCEVCDLRFSAPINLGGGEIFPADNIYVQGYQCEVLKRWQDIGSTWVVVAMPLVITDVAEVVQ
jgi:hypothetical protein